MTNVILFGAMIGAALVVGALAVQHIVNARPVEHNTITGRDPEPPLDDSPRFYSDTFNSGASLSSAWGDPHGFDRFIIPKIGDGPVWVLLDDGTWAPITKNDPR